MTKFADVVAATATRPFQVVNVPDTELTELRRRVNDDWGGSVAKHWQTEIGDVLVLQTSLSYRLRSGISRRG
jgi:hypothetical protein